MPIYTIGSESMNKFKYFISVLLMILLIETALGYPGMQLDNNTAQDPGMINQIGMNNTITANNITSKTIDMKNATASDQDIILVQHLIEVDAVQLKPENRLILKETLIFRNVGTRDFYGSLRTWIPDGSENIKLSKSEMMTGGGIIPLAFNQSGNIISWEEYVEQNSSLPFLYVVEYSVQIPAGTSSDDMSFSKKLAYPTLINYKYIGKSGLTPIVIKVTKPERSIVNFIDENGNKIIPSTIDDNGTINRFNSPQFKEVKVEISTSSGISAGTQTVMQSYAVYVVLGIFIILVLLYPVIRKKLKPEENAQEDEEIPSEDEPVKEIEEAESSASSAAYREEFKEKSNDELETLRKDLIVKLKDLDTKYKSGDLLDEEYEETKNSYQGKIKTIDGLLK